MFLRKILNKFQKKRYENYLKITEYYNKLSKEELTCEYINIKASYHFKKVSFVIFTPIVLFAIYIIVRIMFVYSSLFPKITMTEITPNMIKIAIISSICLIISSILIIYLIIKVILNILRYNYQKILILEQIISQKKKG